MPAHADAPVLSLVMPVYNEAATLERMLKLLGSVDFPVSWELIIVDDGSSDGAVDRIDPAWVASAERVRLVRGRRNQGKGAAVRAGFAAADGQVLGIQDADLEYDPVQIPALIAPIIDGTTEVVFGTRQFGAHAAYSYWYVVGNRGMSTLASAMFNRYVTDVYTCYKFLSRESYERLRLRASGFDIEAELTGQLLRSGARILEIPIRYAARGREEGKKIRAVDGLRGVLRLLRVRFERA